MHPVIMCPQGYDVESGANNSASTCARKSVTDRPGAGWWQHINHRKGISLHATRSL